MQADHFYNKYTDFESTAATAGGGGGGALLILILMILERQLELNFHLSGASSGAGKRLPLLRKQLPTKTFGSRCNISK